MLLLLEGFSLSMLPILWEEHRQGLGAQPLSPDPSAPKIILSPQLLANTEKPKESKTREIPLCRWFVLFSCTSVTTLTSRKHWSHHTYRGIGKPTDSVCMPPSYSVTGSVLQGVKNVKMWSKTTTTSSFSSQVHLRCGIGLGMRQKLSVISLLSAFSTPASVQIQVNLPSSLYLSYKQPAGRKGNHCHSLMTISSSARAGSSLAVLLFPPDQAVPMGLCCEPDWRAGLG